MCTGAPITLGYLPESEHTNSLALISNPPPLLITDPSLLANAAAMQSPLNPAQQSQTLHLSASAFSAAMVLPRPGLPAISKKLYDAIRAGSHVDFAQLAAAKGRSIPPTSLKGQIVLIQAAELIQMQWLVLDFATWIQCFALYAAIIIAHSPERAPGLMAYLLNIAKASIKFQRPSWVVYDQNFRIETANTHMDWLKVDPSIYAQCFSNMAKSSTSWCQMCYSIDHCTENCMIKSRKTPPPTDAPAAIKKKPSQATNNDWPPICRNFNTFNGNCSRGVKCRYRHWCNLCEKPGHYRANCPGQGSNAIQK